MFREEKRYKKLRNLQREKNTKDHGEASKDWEAAEILKRLVNISPYALPIPIAKATETEAGVFHYERQKIEVNHGRLIEIYKQCGGYLHGKNPLVGNFVSLVNSEKRKYKGAPVQIRRALTFLRKLLWCHAAITQDWTDTENPTSIDNPKEAWILNFGENASYEIQLIIGEGK